MQLVKILISYKKNNLIFNQRDEQGKTLIHHVISPFEEGSFENEELLNYLLKLGFEAEIKDNSGLTPLDYANKQKSDVNFKTLAKFLKSSIKRNVTNFEADIEWEETNIDYEEDTKALFESKLITKDDDKVLIPKPDEIGKFNKETHSLVKDSELGYYDCTMTKVNIHNGMWSEYIYYKMQVIHDSGRDVYILWNRWGRIGNIGEYQRTPFANVKL